MTDNPLRKDVEMTPLPWRPASRGSKQFELFCQKYLKVPKGKGARHAFRVRPWQKALAGTILDDPLVQLAVWVLPRGNGKSGISAAVGLHHLFYSGLESARCLIVAQDERSARRMLETAVKMVKLNPELSSRCRIYKDRIEVPSLGSTLVALPGEAFRIEGEDGTLVIIDEVGFVTHEVFEACIFSAGKREGSKVLCIGTPSPPKWRDKSPLWKLICRGRANPNAADFRLVEYGVPEDADIDDPEVWRKANPAMDDWLTEDTIRSQRKVSREAEFRRARLGQWLENTSEEAAFNPPQWRSCARPGVRIPPGSQVVLALDGSHNGDSTGIVMGSISKKPHYQVVGLWEPSKDGQDVPILEVEDTIRELARQYKVREIVADPYRWQRTLQVLEDEGLPVATYPQNATRMTPAIADLRAAVANGLLTHADDVDLNDHVLRCVLQDTTRGVKLVKPTKAQKIDLAVCLVMAHSRCTWLGSKKLRQRKTRGYKNS